MFWHYMQVATRTLVDQKLYSFLNILGLSVALVCAVLVVLFVRNELAYDKWIPGTENLYRVEVTARAPGFPPASLAGGPYPLGTAMRDQIAGITGMTRIISTTLTLANGDRRHLQTDVDFVDASFFRIIRLPFIEGDPESALNQPESIVLSQSAATRYFGKTDPLGRILVASMESCTGYPGICRNKTVPLRVTGVARDVRQDSQLTGAVFIPMTSAANAILPTLHDNWGHFAMTYISLAPGVSPARVLATTPAILNQDLPAPLRKIGLGQIYTIHLTRFTQVHLNSSRWLGNMTPPGSPSTLYGAIIIATLILTLACVNFVNLATARATLRVPEVGLRKTLGGTRAQLMAQFLTEAALVALVSLACAATGAEILLPPFNGFLQQSMALNYARDWRLDLILVGLALGAGLVSGLYPALILSRLGPVAALRRGAANRGRPIGLRDLLVLVQFTVSTGLGIAVLVVFLQVNYIRRMDFGFRVGGIVVIRNNPLTGERQQAFAAALRSGPGVMAVGLSNGVPFWPRPKVRVELPGKPYKLGLDLVAADPNYPGAYGIALLAGRLLSYSRGGDDFGSGSGNEISNVLINAAGARMLGFTPQTAIGQTVIMEGDRPYRAQIVGVLADARERGAREPVAPTLYLYAPAVPMAIGIRLRAGRILRSLAFIDRTWHDFVPTVALQRTFLSERFEELYRPDEQQGAILGVFAGIAILIACLGLYGLVAFTSASRAKEIALRKVSGARTRHIMRLMLARISLPVVLANIVAWPVTYYFLHHWLEGFAYRISLSPLYFVAGGATALLIACATVCADTWRLARASPVHALRHE